MAPEELPKELEWIAGWDTSTPRGSVAVAPAGAVSAGRSQAGADWLEREIEGTRAHASELLPTLQALCAELGWDARRPASLFVGLGPGSYTGLRVGIATALGYALGCARESERPEHIVRGVASYEAIALDALDVGQRGVVLGDARRSSVYFGHYQRTADDVVELAPLRLVRVDELASAVPDDAVVLAESGLLPSDAYAGRQRELPPPRAHCLIEVGRRRQAQGVEPLALEPLYLRPWQSGS